MASKVESRSVNIYINGQQGVNTLKAIEAESRKVRNELGKLIPGTEAFKNKMAELKSVNKQLQSVRDDIKGVGGAFGWLKTEIGKLGILAAGYLGFQFITSQFQNIISQNGKLSDSLADLRRVSGLTGSEALELNKTLGKIDTRTSVASLRELAIIAGKLGVAKKDIAGFTEAVDKLVVTLGDELGNADQITTELGKILNVFDGKIDADNILHLGNVIVGLANNGVATGAFITDFTQRVAGIAKTANISLASVTGIAAGLEELGQRSESGATAIQKLVSTIATDLPGAARIAGMNKEAFADLFGKEPAEALIKYAEGLTKNKKSFSDIALAFKDSGEEGARVVSTLAAIGQKGDFMREKIAMASELIMETTDVNNGFALKNETLGATLEKLGKAFNKLTANSTLVSFLTGLVSVTRDSIQWIDRNVTAIASTVKVLAVAALAWATYRVALKIATAEKRIWIQTLFTAQTLEKLDIITTTSLGLAKALLTGNLKKARQEWMLLNAAMGTNPYALIAAGIVALGAALYLYSSRTTEAQRAQMTLNAIQAEAVKNAAEQKNRIENLVVALNSENTSYAQKLTALNKLRDIMPDYLKGYTDEEILAGKAKGAIMEYIKSLESKARAEAALAKLTDLDSKTAELDEKMANGLKGASFLDKARAFALGGGQFMEGGYLARLKAEKAEMEKQKTAIREAMAGDLTREAVTPDAGSTGGGASPATAAVANTLDALRTKLADLKKAREFAAIGSKEFIELGRQIIETDKKINKLDTSAATAKASETAAEKAKRKLDELKKDITSWETKADKGDPGSDPELIQIEATYQELLAKATDFSDQKARVEENYNKYKNQRLEEMDNEYYEKVRKNALTHLDEAYAAETSRLTQHLQERLERIDASDQSENDKKIERERVLAEVDEQEYNRTQENLMTKALLLEAQIAAGDLELEEETRIAQAKMELQKQIADNAIAHQQKTADKTREINQSRVNAEHDLQDAIISAGEQSFSILRGIFKNNALLAKSFFVLEKAAAAAKIVLSLQEQLAAIRLATALQIALASTNPVTVGLIPVIKAAGVAQAVSAKVNAGIGLATVAATAIQGYQEGGYNSVDSTRPRGYVNRPTLFVSSASGRPFIAGENYKREYIVSSEQLKDPVIADFVNMMESRRGIARFESGGYSKENTSKTSTPQFVLPDNSALEEKFNVLAAKMDDFTDAANRAWDFRIFERKKKRIDDSRDITKA